jgi:hypothetical protein
MRDILLAILIVFVLIKVGILDDKSKEVEPTKTEAEIELDRQKNWIFLGKEKVREKLKNPDSVKFKNVFFHKNDEGTPTACGQFTSKNSFGAYGADQRFLAQGNNGLTLVEEDSIAFEKFWLIYCI